MPFPLYASGIQTVKLFFVVFQRAVLLDRLVILVSFLIGKLVLGIGYVLLNAVRVVVNNVMSVVLDENVRSVTDLSFLCEKPARDLFDAYSALDVIFKATA